MCFIPFRLVNIHLCQKVASRAERGSRSVKTGVLYKAKVSQKSVQILIQAKNYSLCTANFLLQK